MTSLTLPGVQRLSLPHARSSLLSQLARRVSPAFVSRQPPLERYCPHFETITPKQGEFLALAGREALYGGAAGGGKSDALLMAALQYVDVPGYAALLFRRTFQDLNLPGALMDRAGEWLRGTDARWNGQDKRWTFPSGATLSFGYLEHEQDKYRYQGAAVQFCVARGTPVLMADGGYRPIERIRVGDLVATLEGPRPVARLHSPGRKPVVRVTAQTGATAVVSTTHRLLTTGGWASPAALTASQSRVAGSKLAGLTGSIRVPGTPRAYSMPGRQQALAHARRPQAGSRRRASDAWSAGARSGFAESADVRREAPLQHEWLVPLVLYGPVPPSTAPNCADGSVPRVRAHEPHEMLLGVGSAPGYRHGRDSRDEQSRTSPRVALAGIPSPVGAEGQSQSWQKDDPDCTRECSRSADPYVYAHPYTMTPTIASVDVAISWAHMVPAGEAEVLDLTVAGASHYILPGGIVASNCGFDELTQFSETQYRYLFSRLRRLAGSRVPLRMRSASNPGGVGHDWVYARFIEEGPGAGRVFVPARLDDNPHLDREEYLASLQELDPVTRAQLEAGDWNVKPGGKKFQREWFQIVDAAPAGLLPVRFWDLAATEAKEGKDPDWTAGAKMGERDGVYYIVDVARTRGTPLSVEQLVKQTADLDSLLTSVYMEQEPGASGVNTIDNYARKVLKGFAFYGVRSTGDKELRANPLSSAAQAGNVKLLRGAWNGPFLDELHAFPTKGVHDDQVDAASGAFAKLREGRPSAGAAGGTRTVVNNYKPR